MTWRRGLFLSVLGVLVALLCAALWYGWVVWQLQGDLRQAQQESSSLQRALESQDLDEARRSGERLAVSAGSAADLTDGWDWSILTLLPGVGDDADGVRAISASLDVLATDGLGGLLEATRGAGRLNVAGGLDLDQVEGLRQPVDEGYAAVQRAAAEVTAVDSSGFVSRIRAPYEDYVDLVTGLESGFGAASVAAELLPSMAGGDGPREYLLLVQNNAEVRATGGLPGAFVLLRADGGRIEILRQGGPRDFESPLPEPVLPLSDAERRIYDEQLGTFFQDANFTPDFPRTAELVEAHWRASGARAELDGVLSVDPVALSYVLGAVGAVEVQGRVLEEGTVLEQLLNTPYIELEPAAQDALFADAARAIFERVVDGEGDPLGMLRALGRAGREGRLLVHSFDPAEQDELAGTRVAGELTGDEGVVPHVDVALNDATGSKMSYYLRYGVEVVSEGCRDGGQRLAGSMRLRSIIPASRAADLPDSVTGGGNFGTAPGSQLVLVRIYGPWGGSIDRLRLGGEVLTAASVSLDGRPVATLNVLLSSTDPIDLDWRMSTAAGQTADVEVGVTPSIVPGDKNVTVASSC